MELAAKELKLRNSASKKLYEGKTFEELWKEFGDVTVDTDDCIDVEFIGFEIGTYKMDIWEWFEEYFDLCLGDVV